MHMLVRSGPYRLKVAEAEQRNAVNPVRAQIKGSALLPLFIDVWILIDHSHLT